MERPDITGLSKEQLEWFEWASKILYSANEFQVTISETVSVINSDLKLVNEGKKVGLRILNGEEKIFDRVVVLVKLQNDMKSLSLVPVKGVDKASRNPMEEVSKKIKNGVHHKPNN